LSPIRLGIPILSWIQVCLLHFVSKQAWSDYFPQRFSYLEEKSIYCLTKNMHILKKANLILLTAILCCFSFVSFGQPSDLIVVNRTAYNLNFTVVANPDCTTMGTAVSGYTIPVNGVVYVPPTLTGPNAYWSSVAAYVLGSNPQIVAFTSNTFFPGCVGFPNLNFMIVPTWRAPNVLVFD